MPPTRTGGKEGVRPLGLTPLHRFSLFLLYAATTTTQAQTLQGDPERGRTIVASRQTGLCLLCHTAPIPEERFQGNLAPDLAGAGDRWTVPQLRQRIADSSAQNPDTIMPSYYKSTGLTRVAPAHRGKTILTAQQVEDVVAYLSTLRAGEKK
jgi:sulfur-oxidizing protein SoxX